MTPIHSLNLTRPRFDPAGTDARGPMRFRVPTANEAQSHATYNQVTEWLRDVPGVWTNPPTDLYEYIAQTEAERREREVLRLLFERASRNLIDAIMRHGTGRAVRENATFGELMLTSGEMANLPNDINIGFRVTFGRVDRYNQP